jgi:XTP/dITP diphosphohydrolase
MFEKLLIASNNAHKAKEIRQVLKDLNVEVLLLNDAGIKIEVEEDGETLEENSYKKAKAVFDIYPKGSEQMSVIADDTGLFVDALNGRPGVFSARYAGENATYDDNCEKLLLEMKDVQDEKRTAEFRSVICVICPHSGAEEGEDNEHYFFEGVCRGKILTEKKGLYGFGYDPLFIPDGFDRTFAEMGPGEKNSISHRAKALMKLKKFITGKVNG